MGPSNISFADFKNKGSREKIKDGKNNSGGGGGDMESRVARLESDVSHIRTDISDIKFDIRKLSSDNADLKANMLVLIQKIDGLTDATSDIKRMVIGQPSSEETNGKFDLINSTLAEMTDKVSKRPSEDKLNVKFTEMSSEIKLLTEKTEGKLKDIRLNIILWILGLPSVIFGVYKLYQALNASA
ncbi:hypothetical protein [Morganella morganii]|uniref:Uncharacterized protein n=1 Tax=Morganella morganii TaxID=582 RepID=A0AAE4FE82_MORMO|nr:hypothetical protein [Morganella morganii]AMG70224.1 hypothetical protein AL531_07645 [Morganella morganii]EJD6038290.1 hypothetical protein [Morganella morganii]EJD6112044.1 hypothetical protein [Morganella morganii]EKU4015897.1 hypothetical protein [Morganella morganii]EKU5663265.1 hypothetical protein [Morganella morganii]